MQHRISAGMLIVRDNRILMVRHSAAGKYDFWVAPGGGVQGNESLEQAAEREVREETGLAARASQLLYIEEFFNPETRHCKFWFLGAFVAGDLDVSAPEARDEYIVEATWLGRDDLAQRQVFPEFVQSLFWSDRAAGVVSPQYVGLREMQFW